MFYLIVIIIVQVCAHRYIRKGADYQVVVETT